MRFNNLLTQKECKDFIDYFNSQGNYRDRQVDNSQILHNWPKAMDLCRNLKPFLQERVGVELTPYQGWIRKYKKGNVLRKHIDGRADFALSIMLGQSDTLENPLLIFYNEEPTKITLGVGDGYFFEGGVVPHERKTLESEYLYGLYLGYKRGTVSRAAI